MEIHTVKVDAKNVLTDIRSGMTDAGLMEKYGLSDKGLKILFQKLGELGLMHQLDGREVLKDLKSGMTDAELMSKYRLSEKALHNLFAEIDRLHLLTSSGRPDDKLDEIDSKFHEIAEDIRQGMSKAELMRKHRLTEQGLEWVSSEMACATSAAGPGAKSTRSQSPEELPTAEPEEVKGPQIDVPPVVQPHSVISPKDFGEAQEPTRESLGMKTFFVGALTVCLLVNLVYSLLADQASTVAMHFVVFAVGAAIAVLIAGLIAGLYLGFRRWFS